MVGSPFSSMLGAHVTWQGIWGTEQRRTVFTTELGIRIRRIHMFLDLLDTDPDLLIRGTNPDPAGYHQAKMERKTLTPPPVL